MNCQMDSLLMESSYLVNQHLVFVVWLLQNWEGFPAGWIPRGFVTTRHYYFLFFFSHCWRRKMEKKKEEKSGDRHVISFL